MNKIPIKVTKACGYYYMCIIVVLNLKKINPDLRTERVDTSNTK